MAHGTRHRTGLPQAGPFSSRKSTLRTPCERLVTRCEPRGILPLNSFRRMRRSCQGARPTRPTPLGSYPSGSAPHPYATRDSTTQPASRGLRRGSWVNPPARSGSVPPARTRPDPPVPASPQTAPQAAVETGLIPRPPHVSRSAARTFRGSGSLQRPGSAPGRAATARETTGPAVSTRSLSVQASIAL